MSELLTVKDVAQVMKCSEDKVIRIFARMDGVIDLGRPEFVPASLSCPPNSEAGRRGVSDRKGWTLDSNRSSRKRGTSPEICAVGNRVQFSILQRLHYRTGFDQRLQRTRKFTDALLKGQGF
jgi:hypothetical protein